MAGSGSSINDPLSRIMNRLSNFRIARIGIFNAARLQGEEAMMTLGTKLKKSIQSSEESTQIDAMHMKGSLSCGFFFRKRTAIKKVVHKSHSRV